MTQSAASCCPPGSHQAPALLNDNDDTTPVTGSQSFELDAALPCYYTPPTTTGDGSTVGLVVYTDVWGFQSRIRSLCDYLARHGNFHVIVPDCFRGETRGDHTDDFVAWIRRTPYETVVARDTQTCLDWLREHQGVTKVGAVGFCWGAWAVGRSSAAGVPWRAAVALHPSFGIERMAFGGDDVGLMQGISCPFLLLPAGNDAYYTKPGSVLLLAAPKGRSILFPDMSHGWSTRGDRGDEKVDRDVKRALQETLDFLVEHLNHK